jgi:hypothetical protein
MKYSGSKALFDLQGPRRYPVNESLLELRQKQALVAVKLLPAAILPHGWLNTFRRSLERSSFSKS